MELFCIVLICFCTSTPSCRSHACTIPYLSFESAVRLFIEIEQFAYGIMDVYDGNSFKGDDDRDGIPDHLDPDDDNDGIPDFKDDDDDNDGIRDEDEGRLYTYLHFEVFTVFMLPHIT